MRIVPLVLFSKSKITLLPPIYRYVLTIFKKYVLLFQRDKPKMHELYYDQIHLFNHILSYFVNTVVVAKWENNFEIEIGLPK